MGLLPERVRLRIDAIDAKWGSVISVIVGTAVVCLAVGLLLVALQIKDQGDQTDHVVTDGQVSRFVNTLGSCEKDNRRNADHNDFWLLQIALSPQQPPDQALAFFKEGLQVYYPNEPDCAYVAFKQVCVASVLTANPRCIQYAREHDVQGKARAFVDRQAQLRKRRGELLDELSPAQLAILRRR
jgi:hypothetical protein